MEKPIPHLAIFSKLRILDVGAGNGMVGEKLLEYGVARLVGLDISETAYKALVKLTAVFSSH